MPINKLLDKIKEFWKSFDAAARTKATDITAYELAELQNIFALLIVGSMVGMPSPPMQIALDLLPDMDEELMIMMNKISTANSPLSDLASVLEVG